MKLAGEPDGEHKEDEFRRMPYHHLGTDGVASTLPNSKDSRFQRAGTWM